MTTKLGKIVAAAAKAKAAEAEPETALARFRIATERGEYTEIPMLGRVWMQLVPHDDVNRIDSDTWAEMRALDLHPLGSGANALAFDTEKAVRTLARAVRDADDPTHATPFGTTEQWSGLDEDLITAAWVAYVDTRQRLNPLADVTISDDDVAVIRAAIEKKRPTALPGFGAAKLWLYLLTTASPPATSTTSESSPGESSPG